MLDDRKLQQCGRAVSNLTGAERARYVQAIFGRIAGRYDLMNRLMTGGQDVRWRRLVMDLASGRSVLDSGGLAGGGGGRVSGRFTVPQRAQ